MTAEPQARAIMAGPSCLAIWLGIEMKAILKAEVLAAHILGNACDLLQWMECSLKSTVELKVEVLAHILGNTCNLLQWMECSFKWTVEFRPKKWIRSHPVQ